MKRRNVPRFLVFLIFSLTACSKNKPYSSTADANQPSPTSTDRSTPTPKVPTTVAAPTPPEPPPQPPAFQPGVTPSGKVLAVRNQSTLGPPANQQREREKEDNVDPTLAPAPSVDGTTIVPAGAVAGEAHPNPHGGRRYAEC